jgi:hypothetical protein
MSGIYFNKKLTKDYEIPMKSDFLNTVNNAHDMMFQMFK